MSVLPVIVEPSQQKLIEITDLSFRYQGSRKQTLDSIKLTIPEGDIMVVAGKSGSGKSTLLRAINGLIPHQHGGDYSGEVMVDGLNVASTKMSVLATKVGYIFQNPENQIFMFSVERDIAFGLENLSTPRPEIRQKVDWAMNVLEINDLAKRAPHELSDGQKQRVAIAGSVVMGQKILIFDEPTSLLDPISAQNVIQLIKRLHDQLGITVLVVEHRLDLVSRIANRLVVIDEGRIILDGPFLDVMFGSNLQDYGVTEPTIVKTAKLLGPKLLSRSFEGHVSSPAELAKEINKLTKSSEKE